LESLTREELIQLVQKQLDEKNEAKETTTKQAEVYFAFFGIFLEPFDIQIILLGIFPTNSTIGTGEGAIGAGEGGSSGRFAPKNGRNCENAQGNGG
jgi:hypothetical protein